MLTLDHKSLVKLLTPVCTHALEGAISDVVRRGQDEITVDHLLRALLDEPCSDVSVLLKLRGVDVGGVARALEDKISYFRDGSRGKPTFAYTLFELFEEAYLAVSKPHGESKIRSGALLFQMAGNPGRYALVRGSFDTAGLGLTVYDPGLFAASLEGAEAHQAAPAPLPPWLPRETVFHKVGEGESLVDVARRFAIDVESVARENGIGIHDPLQPGTTLRLWVLPRDVVPRGVELWALRARADPELAERGRRIDAKVAEIDARLGAQLDAILHHPEFQRLESAWRGLRYLIDHVDFRENIRVELLNVSKDDLREDFEDAADIRRSGLHKALDPHWEPGPFSKRPAGLLVGDYAFAHGAEDVALLRKIATVAARWNAPFVAQTTPAMFGLDTWEGLSGIGRPADLFADSHYADWRAFRESDDARYVGLTMPRVLLRLPYGADTSPAEAFPFEEDVRGRSERLLWGNAAVALAACVAGSFARYRWCPNIIGPQAGGAVENLPLYPYTDRSGAVTQIATEVPLTERREYELSEEGFIALTFRKGLDNACFFSANSCQKPKYFGPSKEGREAETNYRLSTQLPYMFMMYRLAYYLEVLQREQIGRWKERADLERELNAWLNQYVSDMDNPAEGVRSRRPLRQAQIKVEDIESDPRHYRFDLKVRPHFKYMGAPFTLSLVGVLDRE